MVVTVYAMD